MAQSDRKHTPSKGRSLRQKRRVVIALIVAFICIVVTSIELSGSHNAEQANTQSQSSSERASQVTSLTLIAPDSLDGVLPELENAYIADGHSDVSFDGSVFRSDVEITKDSDSMAGVQLDDGALASAVATSNTSSMDALAKIKAVDTSSELDLASDRLVFAAKDDAKTSHPTISKLTSGLVKVGVASESEREGVAARQALSSAGFYTKQAGTGGRFSQSVSPYVVVYQNTDALMSAVQSGTVDCGLVLASDVYRYGGVKIVGSVDTSTYDALTYRIAETRANTNAGASDTTDAQKKAYESFVSWATTDEDAANIWEKYGFTSAS